ncbi:MAG TPA: ABC transporter ATP-binding protein [Anaerolineales bacterium]|nr:ABC transporter ATP-binding protein [Anaerolineales bacterium]
MAVLELDKVEKHFGGLAAVNGVTMKADDGEILAIVGPNGAGKSTLLKLIVGLEAPTRGTIRFDGKEITRYPAHRIRQMGIATVQQTPRHFPTMTVLENVALGALFGRAGAHRKEEQALKIGREALSFVGLADRRGELVGNLNLHEQRFLELARAIAGQPRLLVLDEVMAGLNDTELEASIQIIRTIRDHFNMTIIWVEHVMKAVMRLAERTVVLNFGNVLTEGLPKDVMRHPAVIEAYLGEETQHA